MDAAASCPIPTVADASAVYGDGVELDDPAETYHEASKLYPSMLARQVAGSLRLTASTELQASARRAVRHNLNRQALRLPAPSTPDTPLAAVLRSRRSQRSFGAGAITLVELPT